MKQVDSSLRNAVVRAGFSLSIAMVVAGGAYAQSEGDGIPTPPGGVRMGPLTAYPSVEYNMKRNDNILLQPSGGNVFSDTIQTLSPKVRVEAKSGANSFNAGLGVDAIRFNNSAADNVNNTNANIGADFNQDAPVRLRVNASYMDSHDPRGSTTDPLTPTPNRYRQDNLNGVFGFGAKGAQGRFELEAGMMGKRYTNNRLVTATNDRDESVLGGTFYWRVAPRTSLLAQVKRLNVDMKDSASLLDSKTNFYLVGVTWEATAATTGVFKLGQVKRDYSSNTPDFSHMGWEGQMQWAPLSYSKFEFMTSRQPRETASNFGSFIWSTTYDAKWNHDWNAQFSTAATVTFMRDDYQAVARSDNYNTFGVGATYKMRRWLSLGADVNHQKRDSNVDTADYTRNIFMLFVKATL